MFPHPSVHSVALVFGSKKDTPLTRQNVRRMFTGCTAKLLGVCSFTKYTQALHCNKSSMSHQIQILFGFTQVHSFSLCLVKSLLHVNKKLGRHTRHWNTQLRHTKVVSHCTDSIPSLLLHKKVWIRKSATPLTPPTHSVLTLPSLRASTRNFFSHRLTSGSFPRFMKKC